MATCARSTRTRRRRVDELRDRAARAVDGQLTPGDRVDVVAVDHDTERSGYVMTDAEVVAVADHNGGALAGGSDDVTVTLTVAGTDAPRLAAAVDAGTVMLVRSTGAAVLTDPAPFTPGAKQ